MCTGCGSARACSFEREESALEAPSASKLLERGVLSRAQLIWQVYPRRPALPWTGGISYRIGAFIAALVLPFGTSPNVIPLSGLAVHVLGAAVVIAAPAPAPLPVAIVVLAVWQV